jgi:hypothetical protein
MQQLSLDFIVDFGNNFNLFLACSRSACGANSLNKRARPIKTS